MRVLLYALQVVVGLGLLNVWLVRPGKSTPYRGAGAGSMRAEFLAYGLPEWAMYLVGGLKIAAALCLLAGIWFHPVVFPAAAVVAVLMLGALAMHLRVRDPLTKSLPAFAVLVMCGAICWIATH